MRTVLAPSKVISGFVHPNSIITANYKNLHHNLNLNLNLNANDNVNDNLIFIEDVKNTIVLFDVIYW